MSADKQPQSVIEAGPQQQQQSATFHQFCKLPTELQDAIWMFTIHRRVVSIHFDLTLPRGRPQPPPQLAVCYASRATMLRFYEKIAWGGLSSIAPPMPKKLWFNFEIDTIRFPLYYMDNLNKLDYFHRIRHLEAEWYLYNENSWPENRSFGGKTPLETFEHIQSLTITIWDSAVPEWLALQLVYEMYHTCDPTRLDFRIHDRDTDKKITRNNYRQVHDELVAKPEFAGADMSYFYTWTHANCSCIADAET